MFNKIKKIDRNYFIITLICLLLIFITLPTNYMFGSLTDWITQHIVFPDYFRKLFYGTGNFFPSFAPSIGAGQNIFNFAYYGLYSPLFLLSYLLPFIDMTTYIIGLNIILYIISGLLFYKFFKRHYNKNISLIVTIIMIFSAPLLYHFHKHFMFVSYIPFLILSLIGVDLYFEKNNKYLLVITTFIIILTNYFFSVSSLSVIVLYGLFVYLKKVKTVKIKQLIIDCFMFLIPIFLGVMLASFILLPTAYTLLSGRSTGTFNLIENLIPNLDYSKLLYSSYSLGLTSLAIISLLFALRSKKEYKILSILVLVIISIPLVCLLLNGFLYIREKVFIPYLVIFGLFICNLLENIDKLDKKNLYLFIIFLIVFIISKSNIYFILDYIVTIIILYLLKDKEKILNILIFIITFILCLSTNYDFNYVDKITYSNIERDYIEISKVQLSDEYRFYHLDDNLYTTNKIYTDNYHIDSIYSSTYNKFYYDFYKKVFNNTISYRNNMILAQTPNLLYQTYMGAKYMYSDRDMLGYEKLSNHIYINDKVLPIIYGTDKIINKKEFDKLKYPNTLNALYKGVVSNSKTNIKLNHINKSNLDYNIKKSSGLDINKGEYINIKANKENQLILELNNNIKNKILLIDFKLKEERACSKGDSIITINGISNLLTCKSWIYKNKNNNFHYYIGEDNLKELDIKFSEGEYNIEDINIYEIDYDEIVKYVESVYKPKYIDINGDIIKSSIRLENDGYVVTSIPYDKGFSIYDNGKKIKVEKVNKSFIGFKTTKGSHNIVIKYSAPLFKEGKIISIAAIFLSIAYILINNRKKLKKF